MVMGNGLLENLEDPWAALQRAKRDSGLWNDNSQQPDLFDFLDKKITMQLKMGCLLNYHPCDGVIIKWKYPKTRITPVNQDSVCKFCQRLNENPNEIFRILKRDYFKNTG